jgi:hypothetical protein
MSVVAIIPEGNGAMLARTLGGSRRGGAGLLSEDPAPSAYVLGKWLRRERQHPSIRLPASLSTTTRPPPRGVKGLRSHSHASRRAIYARRSCNGHRRIPLPRTPVNKGNKRRAQVVLRASSERTILVSDRALSLATALRESLASAYASGCKEEG